MNRKYQDDCLAAIKKSYLEGTHRQLVSMATGTGKTHIFSSLPAHLHDVLPGQTLVLAHRQELIDQAINKFRLINPTLKVSKEMASDKADTDSDVIVASVATLGRKGTTRFNWPSIDKVICDEAHHSLAQSYTNVFDLVGLNHPNSKTLLTGFTATPTTGSGKGLADVYKKIVYSYSIRQAIEDSWLVDIRGFRANTATDLGEISTLAGDFDQGQLGDAVNTSSRNQNIVKVWLEYGENRKTIAFAVNIAHAQDLSAAFVAHGIVSEAVWGADFERRDKLDRYENGDTKVLVNVGVLTEGYDHPATSCVILARPTKSSVLFTQCIGRGTRLCEGKADLIVLDVVDVAGRHSLVTLPTLLGMPGAMDLRGRSLVKSAKVLEEAQEQYKHLDFTGLKDITQIKAYVEEINLFAAKVPAEAEAHSKMGWHSATGGGYTIYLPNADQLTIKQNLLDTWELKANIKGQKYKGERPSLEEAFAAADGLIVTKAPEALKLVERAQEWHRSKPSASQLALLAKFYKGRVLPPTLTKGEAARLISAFLGDKKGKK